MGSKSDDDLNALSGGFRDALTRCGATCPKLVKNFGYCSKNMLIDSYCVPEVS
jgi:hypothetical protein